MAVSLQARTLPALAGWSWISGGFALFRRNPPLLAALSVSYLVVLMVMSAIPVIGPVFEALTLPAFMVILFNAVRMIEMNADLSRDVLMHGLEKNYRALVQLGVLQLVSQQIVGVLAAVLVGTPDGLAGKPVDLAAVAPALLMVSPLALLLGVLLWFPPLLISKCDLPLSKALFFGLVGVVRNIKVFGVFFLAVLMLMTAALMFITTIGAFLGVTEGGLSMLLFVAAPFVFLPLNAACVYVSFRQVFAPDEAPAPEPADE